jgi:GAF domain-containing protein
MTKVPRFDERLDRALERLASKVDERVSDFVARAVAARILATMADEDEREVRALREHMASLGLIASAGDGELNAFPSVLSDPARLRALHQTGLLDSPREDTYDRIVLMATHALAVPTAAVSLVEEHRQFFKSIVGVDSETAEKRQTSIERSVCQYAVASGEPLIVEDARVHPQLSSHPAVVDNTLAAYAGIPLSDHDGNTIGTLCVWDTKPRQWTPGHVLTLVDLAALAKERIFGPQE